MRGGFANRIRKWLKLQIDAQIAAARRMPVTAAVAIGALLFGGLGWTQAFYGPFPEGGRPALIAAPAERSAFTMASEPTSDLNTVALTARPVCWRADGPISVNVGAGTAASP